MGLVGLLVLGTHALWAQSPAERRFDAAVEQFRAGEHEAAARELEEILPELTSPASKAGVEALHMLGAIARGQGRYEDSIRWTDRAIAAARETGATLVEAEAFNTKGLALAGLGRYDEAAESIRQSLDLHRQRGDAEQEVVRLYNLGALAQMADRYFDALGRYESALARLDAHAGEAWAQARRGVAVANLASLYQRVGRLERALDLYETIARGDDLSAGERLVVLGNMGALYRRLGDPFKAVETYDRAARLAAEANDVSREIGLLTNRGIALALDLGRLPEADKVFTRVVELARRSNDPLLELHGLLYRGETSRRAGRLADAKKDFEAALALAESLRVVEEHWKALHGLGQLAEAEGEFEEAEKRYREAIEGVESLRSRLEQDTLKQAFLAERSRPYDALIGLLLRERPETASCEGGFCDQILDLIGRQRSRALRDRLTASKADDALSASEIREKLVPLWKERLTAEGERRAELDANIDALEREYQRLERARQADPADEPLSIARAQGELDPATALAVYWSNDDTLLQIWVTREGAGLRRTTFDKTARRAVRQLAEASARPGGDWRPSAETLGRLLFEGAPFLAAPAIRTLLVDPAPAFHPIPWDALVLPTGELLAERLALQHLVLPKSLTPGSSRWQKPGELSLSAFAYSSSGEAESSPPLDLADDEVRSIGELLPGRAELHLEAEAQRAALNGAAPVLHFAAHAVADDDRPELSRITLAPAAGGEGSDYLFLGEIETLDLRDVKLAVLSACETERGREVIGEGVESLGRAFLAAGVDRVIAGLWRVPDRPTAALMEQLYAELGRGVDPAEALRLAKLRIAAAPGMEHPYYWAAFRLTGRTRGAVVRSFPWVCVPTVLALILVAIGLLRRRYFSVPSGRSGGPNSQ